VRQKRAWHRPPNHAVATCARGWKRSRVETDGVRLKESEKLAAKDATKDLDGEEEGILRMNPARVAWIETAGGNDAVEMRMQTPTPTIP
jgi:hypothetical protein